MCFLEKSSDEYTRLATDITRPIQLRIGDAFEAAYYAFIAMLARCDGFRYEGHPNVKLVNTAAAELHLSGPDRELSERLTHAYYNGDCGKFNLEDVMAWAQRARKAV